MKLSNRALIEKMVADYGIQKEIYRSMKRYYDGDHDINYFYHKIENQSNNVVVMNFVAKLIQEELGYSLGNDLSYVSMSGNKEIIDTIYQNTFHWDDNHNQELMRTLEIYGKAYALHYIDNEGRFCERILSPLDAICYCDENDTPQLFIHFYKKKYEDEEYKTVYYPDGRVITYRGNTKVETKRHYFKGVPVSVCKLGNIHDTIYYKIKSMQDDYNRILSDQSNTISDFRNAYLVITGVKVTDEDAKALQEETTINLPTPNTSVRWLTKELNDTYIQNHLENLKNDIYAITNHIDGNEKLQSNTSGTALRNRLIFLEQRCKMMVQIVVDTVYERIERLFEYLALRGKSYPIIDIKIVSSPCIPQDEIGIVQMLTQLGIGENISLETSLALLSCVENPAQEIAKIRAEQREREEIELEKVHDFGLKPLQGDE